MRSIQSLDGLTWQEILPVIVTDEQKAIFESHDQEAIKTLVEELNAKRYAPVSEADAAAAIAVYNTKKPELKEGDEYQLIAINGMLNDENVFAHGVINCRVNGEHIQVRF